MSNAMPNAANQEWSQAVGNAQAAAASVGEMASHAASAAGAMASQAAGQVSQQADDLTASAGAGIHELGDKLSRSAPQTGMLGSASQAVAGAVRGGGEYLEDAKLSGMSEDVAQLIRRNPIPAVLLALGLGWFVASRMRS
jgi:hypothetical protein